MATFSDDQRFASLVSALKLIAAEAEQQRSMLPELRAIAAQIRRGEPAGELLDETLVREGSLPADVGLQIQHIDEQLDQLLASAEELTATTLSEAPEWKEMRAAAREALSMLGFVRFDAP